MQKSGFFVKIIFCRLTFQSQCMVIQPRGLLNRVKDTFFVFVFLRIFVSFGEKRQENIRKCFSVLERLQTSKKLPVPVVSNETSFLLYERKG
jgi:hypothetical protein